MPTTEATESESGTELEVRCPEYITENCNRDVDTPFEHIENAHDEIRGAMEELAEMDNPGVAAGLLLSAVRTIGQALEELMEEHELGLVPTEEDSRHIGKLVAADPNLAALAEKASHEGPDAESAVSRCLSLMNGLVELAGTSERLENAMDEPGRIPISRKARGLIYRLADELEDAREEANHDLVRRDYALAVLSGDPDGYAASRGDNPPIQLSGNGGGES